MLPTIALRLAALDALCCMGIGFFVAALRVVLPAQHGLLRFIADFFAVLAALLLAQGYAAQASNAGGLRFYMVLGLALGAFVFVQVVAPYCLFYIGVAGCVVGFPFRIISHKLVVPLFLRVKRWFIAQKELVGRKKEKRIPKKRLQKQPVLLYNSNVELYTFRDELPNHKTVIKGTADEQVKAKTE